VGISDTRLPQLATAGAPLVGDDRAPEARLEGLVMKASGRALPADWTDLISACLRRDPDARPTAEALLSSPAVQQGRAAAAAAAAAGQPLLEIGANGGGARKRRLVRSGRRAVQRLRRLTTQAVQQQGEGDEDAASAATLRRRGGELMPLQAKMMQVLALLEDAVGAEERALTGALLSNQEVIAEAVQEAFKWAHLLD